ncbi:Protein btg1 [Rhizophlyctis rosea]|uniref:Protein btg1 n=1 Tax=Rhizophlyctis rosea TaxID=64517 RepID=A0AAD5S7R7_9FUNG|nr:Protein btg1 [Rhizophlyctis rosea]
MYTEITTASTFLAKYLPHKSTPPDKITTFRDSLTNAMAQKFRDHWDPTNPMKGNGFRSIHCQMGRMDPLVGEAARRSGLRNEDLYFPNELVLWTDPRCVSFRVGDHGGVVVVWEDNTSEEAFGEVKNGGAIVPSQLPTPPPEKQVKDVGYYLHPQHMGGVRPPRSPSMRSTSSVISNASTVSASGTWSPPPSPPQSVGFPGRQQQVGRDYGRAVRAN